SEVGFADEADLCTRGYCSRSISSQVQQHFCCVAACVVKAAVQRHRSRWISNRRFAAS
ncbi:MAG: hypothetical protein ACI80I_002252, partial [Akkermansiaceae bacterium]